MDLLASFIDKHCSECPKFAAEFDQLSHTMTQRTLERLSSTRNHPVNNNATTDHSYMTGTEVGSNMLGGLSLPGASTTQQNTMITSANLS